MIRRPSYSNIKRRRGCRVGISVHPWRPGKPAYKRAPGIDLWRRIAH